jgi:hypothetical protein
MATEPRRVSRPGVHAHEILDAATLRTLARSLSGSDLERCRASIEVLRELRPDMAPALLADAIPGASDALRPHVLESLEAQLEDLHVKPGEHRVRAHALGQLLRERPPLDARQRAALVRVYARLQAAAEPDAVAQRLLTDAAHDPAPAVRVAAETALYRLGLRAGSAVSLRRVLGPALEHEDPQVRELACPSCGRC